jgi:hypothetical protein
MSKRGPETALNLKSSIVLRQARATGQCGGTMMMRTFFCTVVISLSPALLRIDALMTIVHAPSYRRRDLRCSFLRMTPGAPDHHPQQAAELKDDDGATDKNGLLPTIQKDDASSDDAPPSPLPIAAATTDNDDILTLLRPSAQCDPTQLSGTHLAYIGDCVYELFVRSKVVWPPKTTTALQARAVGLVNGRGKNGCGRDDASMMNDDKYSYFVLFHRYCKAKMAAAQTTC